MSDDDKFYEQALNELENDTKIKSTWARAYANSEDEDSAKRLYIRNRVEQLQGEQVDELQADKKSSELEVSQDASEAKKPPKKKVDTSAKDKLPMEPMAGTYKAIFVIAIFITLGSFLLLVESGSQNAFPTFIWFMTVWYMHKRNYQGLVSLQKFVMGFAGVAIVVFAIIGFPEDETVTQLLGISPVEAIVASTISLGVHFWLLRFFQKQLLIRVPMTLVI